MKRLNSREEGGKSENGTKKEISCIGKLRDSEERKNDCRAIGLRMEREVKLRHSLEI